METQNEPDNFPIGGQGSTVIDLSRRLSNDSTAVEPNPHEIVYVTHEEAALAIGAKLGATGLWREGRSGAAESITLTTHSGTHIDAPYHYWPTSEGEPARRIDSVPMRWCIGDGVLLDFSDKQPGDGIEGDEVERKLAEIGHELKPFEIVLVRTDASRHFGEPGYHERQPGLRRSATELLVDAGVRMVGIDAWGLDRPFGVMVEEGLAGDIDQFWESHYLGMEKEYCQIEQLCNLDRIPVSTGFTVVALPVLIAEASASWARVVAIVPDSAPA